MPEIPRCIDCNRIAVNHGISADGPVCYGCCAGRDLKEMNRTGRTVLYLDTKRTVVTNWPGSLSFICRVKKGRHNIAKTRYDVWFNVNGSQWHGVTYGEYTQLCHCKRSKDNG